MQGQASQKDKDIIKQNSDLSEDLFKVHDFDVKIDLQVPNAGKCLMSNNYITIIGIHTVQTNANKHVCNLL